jgi:AcrR family transcriptional regulator
MARTRSASAHKKVLLAALELVAEQGVDATSMDGIARKAGVRKATIYTHWTDKDGLLLEMLAEVNGLSARPLFESGDTKADMIAVLSYRPRKDAGTRERITPHFVAYSARNSSFGSAWRNMVMEPPRRNSGISSSWELRRESCHPNWTLTCLSPCFLAPFFIGISFFEELRRTREHWQRASLMPSGGHSV